MSELNGLIEVNKDGLWVSSNLVARKLEVQHSNLTRTIEAVIEKLTKLKKIEDKPKWFRTTQVYRKVEFEVYMMSREFFSLVAMRLSSLKAFEWQVKFNNAFYSMEKRLLSVERNASDVEWNSQRVIGKTARVEVTCAIKDFVDYATAQGSVNAKHYYKHVTNASYKALGLMAQRTPKLRDELGIYELSELMLAERLAARKLTKYMALGRNYKDIYESVREDLIEFGESLKVGFES